MKRIVLAAAVAALSFAAPAADDELVPRHDWIRKPDYLAKIDKVEALCARLKREDPKLWAGLTFFGHNEARVAPDNEGTVDQSHLTDLGSMRFGTVMGEEISSILTVAE